MAKRELTKTASVQKQFSYTKGDCTLPFMLSLDDSSELRDFRDILKAALADVEETLKGMKN